MAARLPIHGGTVMPIPMGSGPGGIKPLGAVKPDPTFDRAPQSSFAKTLGQATHRGQLRSLKADTMPAEGTPGGATHPFRKRIL